MRESGTPAAATARAEAASDVPDPGGSSVMRTHPPALAVALSAARSQRRNGRPGR